MKNCVYCESVLAKKQTWCPVCMNRLNKTSPFKSKDLTVSVRKIKFRRLGGISLCICFLGISAFLYPHISRGEEKSAMGTPPPKNNAVVVDVGDIEPSQNAINGGFSENKTTPETAADKIGDETTGTTKTPNQPAKDQNIPEPLKPHVDLSNFLAKLSYEIKKSGPHLFFPTTKKDDMEKTTLMLLYNPETEYDEEELINLFRYEKDQIFMNVFNDRVEWEEFDSENYIISPPTTSVVKEKWFYSYDYTIEYAGKTSDGNRCLINVYYSKKLIPFKVGGFDSAEFLKMLEYELSPDLKPRDDSNKLCVYSRSSNLLFDTQESVEMVLEFVNNLPNNNYKFYDIEFFGNDVSPSSQITITINFYE